MKKLLTILLAALLLLMLLPSTAFAEPPKDGCPGSASGGPTTTHNWKLESDTATCTKDGKRVWKCTKCGQTYGEKSPAKGHKWDGGKVTTAATCEHDGIRKFTCTRCKATYTKAIPALGHDWDEGTVTKEPSYFIPGVKTYTCRNDASHTYTEEIDPAPWMFATLSGSPVDPSVFGVTTYSMLTITEQPKSGSVTRYEDGTHTMHVTASGGTGEYTYEWHTHAQEVGQDKQNNDLLKWFVGLFGVTPEQVDEALQESYSDTDTLTTSNAGQDYYCVVTDSAGNKSMSDYAYVGYKVRIAKQPDDVNLQSDDRAFYCEAADGSGDYTYRWYDSDMGILGEGQTLPATEPGICYCYCIVTDNVSGETATSEYCEVYSTEPFKTYAYTGGEAIWDGEKWTVMATFMGGVEPYEAWWTYNGETLDTYEGELLDGCRKFCTDTYKAGEYVCHAVDARGATAEATVYRMEKNLKVLRQPVGGELPRAQYVEISAEFSEGEAPYTYYLYCNGKAQQVSNTEPSFKVWYPCTCSILAVDAKGRSVMTKTVTVSEPTFRIKEQTEQASITYPYGKTRLYVEAENGTLPYTYEWSYGEWSYEKGRHIWYKLDSTESYCDAARPGKYRCLVRDAEKRIAWSKEIAVEYTGSAPLIVTQPTSRIIEKDADGDFLTTFHCEAISANTGDQLLYEWYWRAWEGDGSWQLDYKTVSSWYQADKPGMYQCKVINLENDTYTWSEVATAIEKLECVSARPARSSGSSKWVYQFSFSGGAGPYEIIICHTFGDNASPYAANIVRKTDVWFEKDMKLLTFTLPKYDEFWHVETQSNDVEAAQYYLFVTDAVGQECTTPLVTWY